MRPRSPVCVLNFTFVHFGERFGCPSKHNVALWLYRRAE
jgi:hypothetical protein